MSAAPSQVQPITLRPYQTEAVKAVKVFRANKVQRQLLVMPTGTGKTSVFTHLGNDEVKVLGGRVLIIAHRIELLEQAANRIRQQAPGCTVSIESGDSKAHYLSDIIIAGVQSLGRAGSERLSWFKPTLVIVDEAHHSPATGYGNVLERFGCFDEGGPACVGVTATPHRMDNKPLAGSDKAVFESLSYQYTLRQAIDDGWLCDIRAYRVAAGYSLEGVKKTAGDFNSKHLDDRVNTHDENIEAYRSWAKVAKDRRTIVFCTSVDHARAMAKVFNVYGEVPAESVDGTTPADERAAILKRFRSGETQVLTNCEICTEGFDLPEINCVILLRPTQSWALFTQMVGRGLRIAPGKDDCLIIDVCGISDNQSLASVPAILDLPPKMDMAERTAKEALRVFDDLSDYQKALLWKRDFNLSAIDGVLREVDLLAELTVPEDIAAVSKYSWVQCGDDTYSVGLASSDTEEHRKGKVTIDTLGNYQLVASSTRREERFALGDELATAFRLADRHLETLFGRIGAIADRNAPWRKAKPSPAQIGLLKKLGATPGQIEGCDKGMASSLIDRLMTEKRARTR